MNLPSAGQSANNNKAASGGVRIGTRGSPLALAQAEEVKRKLLHHSSELAPENVIIQVIRTTGDRIVDRPLAEIGGKGLFTKEIEEALLSGAIDIAVHSMKDMPTVLPEGLVIDCLLEREDPRDVLLVGTPDGMPAGINDLPKGAVVGTSSLRREAQVRYRRPDLQIVGFRGNVGTRLKKLQDGVADATLLAAAGLNRLQMQDLAVCKLQPDTILPAVAQGTIGIERRQSDERMAEYLAPLHHAATAATVSAERAFLAALDGSCRTPIAGYAVETEAGIWFRGQILRPDGSEMLETARTGPAEDAAAMGRDAGDELRRKGGVGFFRDD